MTKVRALSSSRLVVTATTLGGIGLVALGASAPAQEQASFVRHGEAGFVVSDIAYALSEHADITGACPNGYTLAGNRLAVTRRSAAALLRELGAPEEQIKAVGPLGPAMGLGPTAVQAQQQGVAGQGQGTGQRASAAQGQGQYGQAQSRGNPCSNPEQYGPDPLWRTVEVPNIPAYGIDLDGQNSTASGRAAPGTCPHTDFRGFHGESGIDNQFFRAVGCTISFQPGNMSTGWATEMLTGAYGIVIRLRGVDDIRNDPSVEVDIAANNDPITLSPTRVPIPDATYSMHQDSRYRATTHGRIVDGVLTTDPVNVRFHKITNNVWFDRNLDDARLRLTVSAGGMLDGVMAGYTPVEDIYNFQFGMQHGTNGAGRPLVGSGTGAQATVGYSCNGAYYALQAAADGHRDPATGHCSAISTQYRLRAIPAFIVDAPTKSINASLAPAPAQ